MPQKLNKRQILILKFLGKPNTHEGLVSKSSYIAALYDARLITGRSEKTGEVQNSKLCGSWAGALVYMVLLDQIGKIFSLKNNGRDQINPFSNGFKSALWEFTKLTKDEINALYALRCSFAHSYGLYNIPNNKTEKKMYHFFEVNLSNVLIVLPDKQWRGKQPIDHTKYRPTVISLLMLGDLVESIHNKLISETHKNNIILKIRNGKNILDKDQFIKYRL